jgi:four helix bundle protein
MHAEAELNRKFVETAKLMNVYLNHFPRHEKYALSQQIRQAAYDVYALIVEAQKRYHKKTTLTQLDIRHEQLRMLINLSFDLGYFEFKDGEVSEKKPAQLARHRHLAISRLVDELGRMIGGWLIAERRRETP